MVHASGLFKKETKGAEEHAKVATLLWYMVKIVHAALCLYLLTSRICRAHRPCVKISINRRLREAGRQGWQDGDGVNVEPRYTKQQAGVE